VLSAVSAVPVAILQRRIEFKLIALRVLVGNIAGGVIGVGFALAGMGLWSLVAQQLSAAAIASAVLWVTSDWRPRFRFSMRHLRDVFSFGVNIAAGGVMRFVSHHADQFLIGALLGTETLGIYVIGMRAIRFVIELASKTLGSVALPVLSRFQSDLARMRRAIYATGQANGFVAVPAFLGLAAIAPDFVPAAFGAKWMPSVPVMQVLSVYAVMLAIRVPAGPVVNAMGKPAWTLAFSGVEAVLGVALIAFAAPHGVVAVAGAVALLSILIVPFFLIAIRRLADMPVRRILEPYAVPLLASLVMVGVVLGVRMGLADASVWLRLPAAVAAGGVVYLALVRLLSPAHFAEVLDLVMRALPGGLRPAN
jgi:PST family polysaccharide transporter